MNPYTVNYKMEDFTIKEENGEVNIVLNKDPQGCCIKLDDEDRETMRFMFANSILTKKNINPFYVRHNPDEDSTIVFFIHNPDGSWNFVGDASKMYDIINALIFDYDIYEFDTEDGLL